MGGNTKEPEFWRIFTTEDGSSAMERANIEMVARASGALQSKMFSATGFRVAHQAPNNDGKWHTASRRQLGVTLAGESELETGDGKVLVARPGIVTIVEDVTGIGHITRSRGDQGRLVLFISLDDDETVGVGPSGSPLEQPLWAMSASAVE